MMESMDITFLLVNTSSMNPWFPKVTELISSIINPLIQANYNIRLALIKFRSVDSCQVSVVRPFTSSITNFQYWLDTDIAPIGQCTQDGTTAICDALRETLNLNWRTTNNDQFHENIIFLITDDLPCRLLIRPTAAPHDDCPCACDDLWEISHELANRNVMLVIVGVGHIVSICDNLYGGIAKNTGGEYIPLTNANHILFVSVTSIVTQGYTLSQSFRHIKQEEFEKNSSYRFSSIQKEDQSEIKHCQVMAQKGAWLLNHSYHVNYE